MDRRNKQRNPHDPDYQPEAILLWGFGGIIVMGLGIMILMIANAFI